MARTLAVVEKEIDQLRAAIGSGALRVRFADRDVTYRSLNEMRESLAMLEQEKDTLNGIKTLKRFVLTGSKGL